MFDVLDAIRSHAGEMVPDSVFFSVSENHLVIWWNAARNTTRLLGGNPDLGGLEWKTGKKELFDYV